jgi:serine/threonine protein kinase
LDGLADGVATSGGAGGDRAWPTGADLLLGPPDYMAPEQISGRPADGRTDQYALACAAFELLSGGPPFQRVHGLAVIYAHSSEPPPALTSVRPGAAAGGGGRRAGQGTRQGTRGPLILHWNGTTWRCYTQRPAAGHPERSHTGVDARGGVDRQAGAGGQFDQG